jgi:NAD(P)-dependent dehydrogenase (short-subunit alcohol dehydrogenase family)
MKIEGATALVTGANRGIGKAFSEALLERGAAKVYAGVRDPATITDPRLFAVRLDVTDEDRVREVAAELTDVDLVVNNAGTGHFNFPLDADLENARKEIEVNYLGIVSMTKPSRRCSPRTVAAPSSTCCRSSPGSRRRR